MSSQIPEEEILRRVSLRINAIFSGLALGLLLGAALFLATIWLVIKDGPDPGPHLGLLGEYFPGYTVTLGGAFLGFLYALLAGFVTGWAIGAIYNRLVR